MLVLSISLFLFSLPNIANFIAFTYSQSLISTISSHSCFHANTRPRAFFFSSILVLLTRRSYGFAAIPIIRCTHTTNIVDNGNDGYLFMPPSPSPSYVTFVCLLYAVDRLIFPAFFLAFRHFVLSRRRSDKVSVIRTLNRSFSDL